MTDKMREAFEKAEIPDYSMQDGTYDCSAKTVKRMAFQAGWEAAQPVQASGEVIERVAHAIENSIDKSVMDRCEYYDCLDEKAWLDAALAAIQSMQKADSQNTQEK